MQAQAAHWIPGRLGEYLLVAKTEIVEDDGQPSEIPSGIAKVVIMSVPGGGVFVRLYCALTLQRKDLV